MATFSRFISDDDDRDEKREFEQRDPRDWAWLVRAARDPSGVSVGSAPTDPRQARRSDGLGAALAMKEDQGTKSQMPTLASGDISGDTNTAKRIQIAQWGMENPDEDRLTPEQVGVNEKMLSSTDSTEPTKPPGPDSPSTGYKDPSRYDKAKTEYDKEFGPGKKHKWYSLESTDAWESRRAASQHSLMLDQRQEEEERRQAIGNMVRPSGQAMRMTGAQGDGIYQGYSDGTFKKVGGVLDKDANEKYEPGVVVTGDRWLNRMKRNSSELEPVVGPYASSSENPFLGGAGPLAPDTPVPQKKWIEEKRDPDASFDLNEGQSRFERQHDGSYKQVATGGAKTFAPKSEGAAAKDPSLQAKKDAEKEADELLKGNKEYERASPEAKKATRDMWIRKILEGNKSGGAAPAKPKRTVVVG